MVVPDTKDGSPAKNMVAAMVPAQKSDAKKSKPHKPKVLTRQRNNYEQPGYGNALGYAQDSERAKGSIFQLVTQRRRFAPP
jgi:hypothetical protein